MSIEAMKLALEALERYSGVDQRACDAENALRTAIEQAEQEPVTLKSLAAKAGVNLPEQYIPTMDDALAAGNYVIMSEQAALLRECRVALDSLIYQKPGLAGLLCGSTTLGNLRASMYDYRPQGVFGDPVAAPRPWVGLTYEEMAREFYKFDAAGGWYQFARAIEAQLKEKNT